MSTKIKVRIERLKALRAVYFHALSSNPEEDAWTKAESWAKKHKLLAKDSKIRIFGRNTYPTKNPEPHGYGFYVTITPDFKVKDENRIRIIPGGLYAVARGEGLEQIGVIWQELWKWVTNSEYKYIGETKGEYGFELGFEELINWHSAFIEKTEGIVIFDLMIQLWEK